MIFCFIHMQKRMTYDTNKIGRNKCSKQNFKSLQHLRNLHKIVKKIVKKENYYTFPLYIKNMYGIILINIYAITLVTYIFLSENTSQCLNISLTFVTTILLNLALFTNIQFCTI